MEQCGDINQVTKRLVNKSILLTVECIYTYSNSYFKMSHRFSIILVLVFLMVPCYCIAKPLSGNHDDNLGDDVYSEGEKITSSIGTRTSGKHEMKFMDTKQAIDNSEESDLSSGRFAFRRLRRRSTFKIPVSQIPTIQYEENCKPPKTLIDNLNENPNTAAMISLSELAEAQEVYRSQGTTTTTTTTTVAYQSIQKRSDTEYTEAENVCADVLKRLNLSVTPNSDCPWRYTCDYVGNRFPRYIIQANCTKYSYCQIGCGNVEKICRPITAQMTVLYGDCNVSSGEEEEQYPGIRNPESNWSTEQFEITLGCKCTPLE